MTGRARTAAAGVGLSAGRLVLPLALAQFVASFAGTNMNVAISAISQDIGASVRELQTTITLFTLTMAALMIPGSKLTDIWGRKRCFLLGLGVYGVGGLIATLAQGITAMFVGYSLLEGVGSALMIPPIYIIITVAFASVRERATWFGVVSGAGGLGAALGPLLGGIITTGISWRASFAAQVLAVAVTAWLARRITTPAREVAPPRFDLLGAVLSGLGLALVVMGFNASGTFGWGSARIALTIGSTEVIPQGGLSPVWILLGAGVVLVGAFFWHLHRAERSGREPLLHLRLFRDRTADLGLGTQTAQWLVMQGSFFTISVWLQERRDYSAIATGLALTPATLGILLSSGAAGRLAQRRSQRDLVVAGFLATVVGVVLILGLVRVDRSVWLLVPGLLIAGLGLGTMLTSSVNLVQSSFPDADQGDISGLSRSMSNLGSSLGTAMVGSAMVGRAVPDGTEFAIALGLLVFVALVGLLLSVLIPNPAHGVPAQRVRSSEPDEDTAREQPPGWRRSRAS